MEEEQAARTLVQAHLRGRTRWTLAVGAVLLVLTVGGCGEFFRSVDASEALAHSGVKTKARIDSASNYRRHSVVEGHLYVTYETPQGVERHVRVWLPEDTHYRAGAASRSPTTATTLAAPCSRRAVTQGRSPSGAFSPSSSA
jgi:hypothetical protein